MQSKIQRRQQNRITETAYYTPSAEIRPSALMMVGEKGYTMTFERLQAQLNTPHTDIFLSWNDTPTMRQALILLYAYNYHFVCAPDLDTAQSCENLKRDMETFFYKYAHGNCKPILHIFYNGITHKNDLQLTCNAHLRTYPQYKNAKIHTLF